MPENEKLPAPVNLKHRLIGAVILVSAAVILVPVILSEREPPAELKAISDIPGKHAPAGDAGMSSEYAIPAPAPEQASPPVPEKKAAIPAPPKTPAVVAKPDKGWVVQVGIFANAANAARLGEHLKQQGHAVTLENITQNNEKRTRLRVGPFADKNAAQQAQAKIQQQTGVAGAVVATP